MSSGARAVPFHCPYCGDEDLRPHGEQHGAWECRGCMRAFRLSFVGLLNPAHVGDEADAPTSTPAPAHLAATAGPTTSPRGTR